MRKFYSLIDKVYSPQNLRLAWDEVKRNKGAAGEGDTPRRL
jgi:retron-type reverse transcriptase